MPADIPLFLHNSPLQQGETIALSEETARHAVQVLRMGQGDELLLTDGNGSLAEAVIVTTGKKSVTARLESVTLHARPAPALHLAVAFTRNAARNEWLLEKATELGVQRITPLITQRTARERIREDRLRGILTSAMLQSQQYYLPRLDSPTPLDKLLAEQAEGMRLIAHCMAGSERQNLTQLLKQHENALLLIGPEGDFTPEEVSLAETEGCRAISLGSTRLRTETAAMAACAVFHLMNDT